MADALSDSIHHVHQERIIKAFDDRPIRVNLPFRRDGPRRDTRKRTEPAFVGVTTVSNQKLL